MTLGRPLTLPGTLPPPVRSAVRVGRTVAVWGGLTIVGMTVVLLIFVAVAPRLLGWHFVIVAGGSMEPTIPLGSVAILEDAKGDDVGVGDVVLFPWPADGHTTTHRIIAVSADGTTFTTKGDANGTPDPDPVPRATVRAHYLFHITHAGDFVNWVKSPAGFLVVILVPGVAIVLNELAGIGRTVRRRYEAPVAEAGGVASPPATAPDLPLAGVGTAKRAGPLGLDLLSSPGGDGTQGVASTAAPTPAADFRLLRAKPLHVAQRTSDPLSAAGLRMARLSAQRSAAPAGLARSMATLAAPTQAGAARTSAWPMPTVTIEGPPQGGVDEVVVRVERDGMAAGGAGRQVTVRVELGDGRSVVVSVAID